jgi:hypothetical protein
MFDDTIPVIALNSLYVVVLSTGVLLLTAAATVLPCFDDSWSFFDDRTSMMANSDVSVQRAEGVSSCLKVFESPMTWGMVQTACNAAVRHTPGRHVHLLSSRHIIRAPDGSFDSSNSALFKFVISLTGGTSVWVGAHQSGAQSRWQWEVSASSWDY